MTTTTQITAEIETATSLRELCDLINSMDAETYENTDLTSLPTFGGAEPADTSEIWSWDERSLLVSASEGGFEIVPRD